MFITFEGPEGSGKTSQIVLLAAFLRELGYEVVQTREPGGTSIGDQIRDILHDVDNGEITAVAELLLYSASRAQLVQELVQPALAEGKIILCDRYADSTIAYQGYGRGLDLQELHMLMQFATGGLKPLLTLLLDIDVERGLARRQANGDEMNRLDLEKVSFHQKVRSGYHELVEAEPGRWIIIDADRSVDAIQKDLREVVLERVAAWQSRNVAK
jgi:dTMP kinase